MSWLKIDDAMGEHRKVRRVVRSGGLGAFGLHMLGLLHAARYLTDGEVEAEFVEEMHDLGRTPARQQETIVSALVGQGVWLPTSGGWVLHDYLEHNFTRAEIEERREAERERKSAAGKKGAEARWGRRKPSEAYSKPMAGCHEPAMGFHSPVPSRPIPTTPLTPQGGEAPSPPSGKRRRDNETHLAAMAAWVNDNFPGCNAADVGKLVAWMRARRMPTTPEAVREFAAANEVWATCLEPAA